MGTRLRAENVVQKRGQDATEEELFCINVDWEGPGLHVIMGESGVGKSSLLKTLGGVWKPSEGELMLDDRPLWAGRSKLDPELLTRIGFTFQNNALFRSMRVLENLCFPHRHRHASMNESERQGLAMDWLAHVDLGHCARLMPEELSGGMQKRLAIARTLMLNPSYIFLDDPTAGLDPLTSRSIADLILRLIDGRPALTVVVTNDPDRAQQWGPYVHYLRDARLYSPGEDGYEEQKAYFR